MQTGRSLNNDPGKTGLVRPGEFKVWGDQIYVRIE